MTSFFIGSTFGHRTGTNAGAEIAASQASGTASRAQSKAEQLETRLERALMTMEAMWTLMSERLGITEDELQERIVEIDLSDGILDGRVRRPAMECHACNRRIPRRFTRCMYCGVEIEQDPFI